MKYKATPGNCVIEIVNEAMKSSGGLILAATTQKLIVHSISGDTPVVVGAEVEVQPHLFRQVIVNESRYLLGPISGIQAIVEN